MVRVLTPPSRETPKRGTRCFFLGLVLGFACGFSGWWYSSQGSLLSLDATSSLLDDSVAKTETVETPRTLTTQRDYLQLAKKSGTDKVLGFLKFERCMKDPSKCERPTAGNRQCKVTRHFYNTIFQKWLGPYSTDDAEPFQFLEIGYYNGRGFDAFTNFLPRGELHSMEISCIEAGPRAEGKWPWGNFASKNKHYNELLEAKRLHCGDASDFDYIYRLYKEMKRPNAPPLKVVVDDASHLSEHMAISLFFWFPRIEPGGLLIMEDIEPTSEASRFRRELMPQIHHDLHYCGLKEHHNQKLEQLCFPTIQPLLKGIHCEMHICVFERNDLPASDPPKEQSLPPPHALDAKKCLFK